MAEQKKILILYTANGGLGHKVLAQNFEYYLKAAGYEVRSEDMSKIEQGSGVQGFIKLHRFINQRLPWLWRWIYRYGYLLTMPVRNLVFANSTLHVQAIVKEFDPDLIISTQASGSGVASYLKGKGLYKNLFAAAFSDYHFHPYWIFSGVDRYLTNIEEQKQELIKRGIPNDRSSIVGITLKPKAAIDIASVRSKLNLASDEKLVLISSGGQGIGMNESFLDMLTAALLHEAKSHNIKLHLAIVCGKNQDLYGRLKTEIKNPAVSIFGYYSPMAELYSVADLFISKPGGLTVAESLQWNLPMLVTHWLPGQEELNYAYLKSKKLIMPGPDDPYDWKPGDVAKVALRELQSGAFRQSLGENPSKQALIPNETENPFLQAISDMFHMLHDRK